MLQPRPLARPSRPVPDFSSATFTALQQGDTYDQLRVSFPVQINRAIIKNKYQ